MAYNEKSVNSNDSSVNDKSNSEDLEFISRFRDGNRHAFDFLVRKYQRQLYRIIYNMTGNNEDSADLLQNVFINVFNGLDKFNFKSKFFTWLYKITVNTTLNFLKSKKNKQTFSLDSWDEDGKIANFLMPDSKAVSGEKTVLLKELNKKLNESLQKLSYEHRVVIVLFEINGMSHSDIAEILHCTEGTVKSRLHYAREQLKKMLSEYLF